MTSAHKLTGMQVASLRGGASAAVSGRHHGPAAPPLLPSPSPQKPLYNTANPKPSHINTSQYTTANAETCNEVGVGLTLTSQPPYDVLRLAAGGASALSGEINVGDRLVSVNGRKAPPRSHSQSVKSRPTRVRCDGFCCPPPACKHVVSITVIFKHSPPGPAAAAISPASQHPTPPPPPQARAFISCQSLRFGT